MQSVITSWIVIVTCVERAEGCPRYSSDTLCSFITVGKELS